MKNIGKYELHAIEGGEFRLDGGAMFGVIPKVLWERTNPADEKNRIQMHVRSLLIVGEGRKILVDSGLGSSWSEKQIQMFAIDFSRFEMKKSLAAVGVRPEEITDVVLSHLHFDHVGGALNFPKATYWVQKMNLDHAHAPTEKDRASFLSEIMDPFFKSGRVKVIDGNVEIAPGVSTWVTHGHTPGHNMVKVTDGGETVLFCGDTIPMSSHVPVPWVMAFDLHPMTTIEEKKKILSQAAREKWTLFWVHDPFHAAHQVLEESGRYKAGAPVSF